MSAKKYNKTTLTLFAGFTALSLLAAIFLAVMAVAPLLGDPNLNSFFPWLVQPVSHRIWFTATLAVTAILIELMEPSGDVIPESVPKKYRERIMYFEDERKSNGEMCISLRYGWRFADSHWHVNDFGTVKQLIKGLRETQPCDCAECREAIADQKTK